MNRYLKWLKRKTCNAESATHNGLRYDELFAKLYSIPFTPRCMDDENRAYDGLHLRSVFEMRHKNVLPNNDPCSVLEMMIALADRMGSITESATRWEQTSRWFWQMAENLNLDYFDDDRFNDDEVEDIIARLQDGDLDPHGHGGLFIYVNSYPEIKTLSLWKQAMKYINECDG